MLYDPNMTSSAFAKLTVAAHRGNGLCQQAMAVIEDAEKAIKIACRENHILRPFDADISNIREDLAEALLKVSPWLKGMADTFGALDKGSGDE